MMIIFHIDATSPSLSYVSHILLIGHQQNPNVLHSVKHYCDSYFTIPVYTSLLTYYGVWNVDFLRLLIPSFCAGSDMSMLTVLSLELCTLCSSLL